PKPKPVLELRPRRMGRRRRRRRRRSALRHRWWWRWGHGFTHVLLPFLLGLALELAILLVGDLLILPQDLEQLVDPPFPLRARHRAASKDDDTRPPYSKCETLCVHLRPPS